VTMLAAHPDRLTVFCCEATLGGLLVAGAFYFLLRAFSKDRESRDSDRGPHDGPTL